MKIRVLVLYCLAYLICGIQVHATASENVKENKIKKQEASDVISSTGIKVQNIRALGNKKKEKTSNSQVSVRESSESRHRKYGDEQEANSKFRQESNEFSEVYLDTGMHDLSSYTSFPHLKRLRIHAEDLNKSTKRLRTADFPNLEELTIVKGKEESIDEDHLSILFSSPSLSNCKRVILSNLGLTSVPNGLQNLRKLEQLFLETNKLSEVPDWISSFQKLSQLYLKNNYLTDLPDSLLNGMNRLRRLEVQGNKIPERVINKFRYKYRSLVILWR